MSARKRISAEQRKENRKEVALAVLKNVPAHRARCVTLPIWYGAWKCSKRWAF